MKGSKRKTQIGYFLTNYFILVIVPPQTHTYG